MARTSVLLCGLGRMGRNHLRLLRTLSSQCEVVGIVDPATQAAKRAGDIPVFATVDEALSATQPGAAVVATPTATHFEVARRLIEAGLPMLLEKPIAATTAEGEALMQAAEQASVPVMVGHVERFNPAVVAIRRLVREGQLGDIINVSARRVGGSPQDVTKAGHVLIDLAVHDIDITAWLLGEPRLYAAQGHRGRYVDAATLLFSCGSATVDIHVNWVSPIKIRRLSVTGNDGHLDANLITQEVTLTRSSPILMNLNPDQSMVFDEYLRSFAQPDRIQVGIQTREPLREELRAFLNAVAGLSPMPVGAAEGVRALRLAEQARSEISRSMGVPPSVMPPPLEPSPS
ncbi:MAG: Gfo/Idh/MocA family oxidoreductase [Myxococcales bacterium]|nr:Gfo/Idh/MocA family oxidoreductase [Myxococcales bacterium]